MNPILTLLTHELAGSLAALDARQTQLRPAGISERWNIQQVAGHLRLTYAATVEAMDARIAKGTPTKGKPSLVQYAGQFTLVRLGYFPRGRTAPGRVTAASGEAPLPGTELAAALANSIAAMDARIDSAEALFGGSRRVISHMVLGPLSTCQWRRFHLIHGRHHIQQIQAIRREYAL